MSQELLLDRPNEQPQDIYAVEASQGAGSRWRALAGRTLAIMALATTGSLATEASATAKTHKASNSPSVETLYNNDATAWAGYQVSSPAYLDYVNTDFIIPSVSCPPSGESDVSMWAGVGTGVSTDDLYQTGVRLECTSGTESSHIWWEDYPQNSEQDYSGHTVSAGDKIVAQVLPYSGPGHNVELYVYDYGSNLAQDYPNWTLHHEISLSSAPSASTSECVVEQPQLGGSPVDLLDFGSINFSTASSGSFNEACDITANNTDHTIASSTSGLNHGLTGTGLTIENSDSTVLADTSSPSSGGEFTVTWDASN